MSGAVDEGDQRSRLEKLDDLQADHPFPYNVVVGAATGLVFLVFGFAPILVPIYALSYGALRWFLWQEGRVLHRQYESRAARWAEKKAARRRNR